MNANRWALLVLVFLLAVSSSLAIYYRNQAARLRRASPEMPAPVHGRKALLGTAVPGTLPPARNSEAKPRPSAPAHLDTAPAVVPAPDAGETGPDQPPRPRRGGTAWLENIRTNDPARYEAFQQRRREMQERSQDAWLNSMDYFSGRDTSNMREADFHEYNVMMTLLEDTRTMTTQLQSDIPREERHDLMHSVRSNMVVLTPMLERERERELFDMALALGHNPAEAAAVVSYVNQISSNTSLNTIFPETSPRNWMPRNRGAGWMFPGPAPAEGGAGAPP